MKSKLVHAGEQRTWSVSLNGDVAISEGGPRIHARVVLGHSDASLPFK